MAAISERGKKRTRRKPQWSFHTLINSFNYNDIMTNYRMIFHNMALIPLLTPPWKHDAMEIGHMLHRFLFAHPLSSQSFSFLNNIIIIRTIYSLSYSWIDAFPFDYFCFQFSADFGVRTLKINSNYDIYSYIMIFKWLKITLSSHLYAAVSVYKSLPMEQHGTLTDNNFLKQGKLNPLFMLQKKVARHFVIQFFL